MTEDARDVTIRTAQTMSSFLENLSGICAQLATLKKLTGNMLYLP
jgi:hypothetical protein